MTEVAHLGSVSRQYQDKADKFEQVLLDAARAEAEHKAKRAQRILSALASEQRMSHNRAETEADADEEIAALHERRLTTAAIADAHRAKLNQLREQVSVGRTMETSQREVDRMHAEGQGGAA